MSSILGESTALNRQPRSPFKPSAKPTSRKSLSALQGEPTNAQTMMDLAVQAKTVEEGGEKRKRAYSVGGVQGQGKNQLSPRSQARRMAKPRKSILKTANAPSVFSPVQPTAQAPATSRALAPASPFRPQQHAHTINFPGTHATMEEEGSASSSDDDEEPQPHQRRQQEMTFPSTLAPRMTGTTTSDRKAARRAEIAAKRARMSVDAAGGASRRKSVSWSSHAQVRMIVAQEEEPEPRPRAAGFVFEEPEQRRAQGQQPGNSSRRHGRQSSIVGIPAPDPAPVVTAAPPIFSMQPDNEDSAMDIETESEEERDDERAVQAQLGAVAPPPVVRSSIFGSPEKVVTSSRRSRTAGEAQQQGEEDQSMDMDITQIISHGLLPAGGSPASTVSANDDDAHDDTDSDSSDDEELDPARQEERTMDFTVAIGGIIPGAPPVGARENGSAVGYTVPTTGVTEYAEPLVDAQARPMYASGIFSIPANRGFDQFSAGGRAVVEEEGEMSMEETRAFGGVVQMGAGAADAGSDSSMSVEEVDEDDAMDFTIAHGGVVDASSRRHAGPQEEEDDGMDFTIARGGILPTVNVTSPTASTISRTNTTLSAPGTPKAAPQAPSYAQPTSASRARDIYGPSPSPKRAPGDSPDKPKGRSPGTAMEVAKKLVFEPSPAKTTTSKRRSLGAQAQAQSKRKSVAEGGMSVFNDENAPPQQQQQQQQPTSIFASPAKTPAKTPVRSPMKVVVPAKSPAKQVSIFGTPKRLTGNTLTLPSPARGLLPSPAKTNGLTVPTIVEPVWEQEEQYANIPLANFLAMCNVKFSDDGPGARRKSIAGLPPDLLQEMLARDEAGGFTLHDYARAQIWKPFYDMYQWGCQQMKRDYEAGQETLEAIDREASEDNPPVIRDYLAASDEEKGVFETIILNLKRNAHLIAREKWYIWKQTLVSQIQPIMEAHIEGLKEDNARLHKVKEGADVVLPAIKARYEALRLELEQEKKIVAEIEACDQDRLAECKAELVQQNSYIAESTAELNEQKTKLAELQKKLAELNAQQDQNLAAVAIAKKECAQQKGFTKAQVYHLQNEFATLQHLHATTLDSLTPNELVVCFSNQLRLRFKSTNWRSSVAGASVELAGDDKSSFKTACLQLMQDRLKAASSVDDVPKVIQQLNLAWGVLQELDQEFKLVALRYPTAFEWDESVSTLKAKSTIVLPAFRAKVKVAFSLAPETISSWPASAAGVPVEVESVYGENIDLEYLQAVAEDVMASVTPESTNGLILNVALGLISVQTE